MERFGGIPEGARSRSTALNPVPIALDELISASPAPLVHWGVFNPYGPTWNCIGTARWTDSSSILWWLNLNPFSDRLAAVHTMVPGAKRTDEVIPHIIETFKRNPEDHGVQMMPSIPSVVQGVEDPRIREAFFEAPAFTAAQISTALQRYRANPGKPWDRASATLKLRTTRPSFMDRWKGVVGSSDRVSLFNDWWKYIQADKHWVPETWGIFLAWDGSINNLRRQGLQQMADNALTLDEASNILSQVGFPLFAQMRRMFEEQRVGRSS